MDTASLARIIGGVEEYAGRLESPRLDGRILVSYCNTGIGPAGIFYWTLRAMGYERVELAECVTAVSHVIPYTDYEHVVVWNGLPSDPGVVSIYQSSRLMGFKATVITQPLPPAVEEFFEKEDLVYVDTLSPYFTMSLTALRWGVSIGSRIEEKLRASRLRDHVEKGFQETVDSLVDVYGEKIVEIRETEGGRAAVLATPSQLAAAVHHKLLDPTSHIADTWSARVWSPRNPWIVFYATSVEEGYYRDLWFRLRGSKISRIVVNVDPASSSLYTMIIQGAAFGQLA